VFVSKHHEIFKKLKILEERFFTFFFSKIYPLSKSSFFFPPKYLLQNI
jgi:hypothetical protein